MKIRENRDHVVELMGRKVRAWHLGGQIPHSWLALHQTHGTSGMPCTEPSAGTLTWGKFCNMAKFSVWSVHFWKDDVWSLFFLGGHNVLWHTCHEASFPADWAQGTHKHGTWSPEPLLLYEQLCMNSRWTEHLSEGESNCTSSSG